MFKEKKMRKIVEQKLFLVNCQVNELRREFINNPNEHTRMLLEHHISQQVILNEILYDFKNIGA